MIYKSPVLMNFLAFITMVGLSACATGSYEDESEVSARSSAARLVPVTGLWEAIPDNIDGTYDDGRSASFIHVADSGRITIYNQHNIRNSVCWEVSGSEQAGTTEPVITIIPVRDQVYKMASTFGESSLVFYLEIQKTEAGNLVATANVPENAFMDLSSIDGSGFYPFWNSTAKTFSELEIQVQTEGECSP